MTRRLIVFVGMALLLVGAALFVAREVVQQRDLLSEPVTFDDSPFSYELPTGATIDRVARDLHQAGLLDNEYALAWHARLKGVARNIRTGDYSIESGMTPLEMLQLFLEGRTNQYSLTLVEGWTFAKVREVIAADPHLEQTLTGLDDAALMTSLGRDGQHPEGRVFADTYLFPKGTTDAQFLSRAMATMDDRLEEAWESRAQGLPLDEPYDALILASIVEKETGRADERRRIAGVFVERLHKNMLLQTDPTVIYGMGAAFDGNIRRKDLRADTPYNTYVHKGLPPTPIASPGQAALDAVMHPDQDGSLFFVAKGDGSHHFSVTYEEHKKAVAEYQLKRKKQ